MEFAIGPNTKVRKLWFDRNPDRIPGAPFETIVVNNPTDFEKYYDQYLTHEKAGTIFGFDCEWVCADNQEKFAKEGRENWPSLEALGNVSAALRDTAKLGKVSLVQISTFSGVTLLCRVCLWDALPKKFVELIEDPKILKVGYNLARSDSVELFESFRIQLRGTVHLGLFTNHPHFHDSWSSKGGLKAIIHRLFDLGEQFRELNIHEDLRWKSNWNGFSLSGAQKFYAAVDSQAALDAFLHLAPIVCGVWPKSAMIPVGEMLAQTDVVARFQNGNWQKQRLPLCVDYDYRVSAKEIPLDFRTMPLEACRTIYEACSQRNYIEKVSRLRRDELAKVKSKQQKGLTWEGQPITSSSSDEDEFAADDFYGREPASAIANREATATKAVPTVSQKWTKEIMEKVTISSANATCGVGSRSFDDCTFDDLGGEFEEPNLCRLSVHTDKGGHAKSVQALGRDKQRMPDCDVPVGSDSSVALVTMPPDRPKSISGYRGRGHGSMVSAERDESQDSAGPPRPLPPKFASSTAAAGPNNSFRPKLSE